MKVFINIIIWVTVAILSVVYFKSEIKSWQNPPESIWISDAEYDGADSDEDSVECKTIDGDVVCTSGYDGGSRDWQYPIEFSPYKRGGVFSGSYVTADTVMSYWGNSYWGN